MPKISIIIPVYNAEKQIEKCLNSCLEQTKVEDTEIILINDGSTDKSEKVIENYLQNNKEKAKKIRFYTKENEGVAKTRNFGIEKAKAEYILFVDCDDYIDSQMLEKLEPYYNKNLDLIKFKLQRVDENDNILEKVDGSVFEEKTGQEAFNELYGTDILLDSPCVYLIKKELFEKNNFKFQRTYHEDFGLIPLLIISAKSVVSTPYYFYQYVQAPNSITRNDDYKKTIQKMEDVFFHYDNMLKVIGTFKLENRTKQNIKIYYTNAIILKLKELNEEDKDKYIKEIKKRKMTKNIKVRNIRQLLKKIVLAISMKLYLKMR